jgi:hypothetical protein
MGGIVRVMLWCDMAWGNGPGGVCRIPEQWTTVTETSVSLPLFTSREACQQDELNIINDQIRRHRSMRPTDPDALIAGAGTSPDELPPPKFDESGRLYSGPDHSRWGECKMMGVHKPVNNY